MVFTQGYTTFLGNCLSFQKYITITMNSYLRNNLRRIAKNKKARLRERAQLSFFIVIFFFALFGVIVIAEVFFIDESKQPGSLYYDSRQNWKQGAKDYDEFAPHNGEVKRLAYVLGEMKDVWRPEYRHGGLRFDRMHEFLLQNGEEIPDYRELIHLQNNNDDNIKSTDTSKFVSSIVVKSMSSPLRSAQDDSTAINSVVYTNVNNATGKDGEWQPVSGTKFKFYVYSAYYDNRVGHFVRVIGATKTKGSDRIWCVFSYGTHDPTVVVPGVVKVIRENWNLKYSACFVMCPLLIRSRKSLIKVPAKVSIVNHPNAQITNLINVHFTNVTNPRANFPTEYEFSVCIKPLHFYYNQVLELLEFLELNQILGVQKFTFYNHTIGKEVNCILQQYIQEGIVEVLPWNLNMVSQKEIRTEGLFAALNDCLYRHMYVTKYLLLIDMDEYIIPHQNSTLNGLLARLSKMVDPRTVGSYSFQNAFFYLQWTDDTVTKNWPRLLTQRKTRRRSKLHPHKQRSKYICLPSKVVEAGNHFVWEMIPGARTLPVPSDAGFLHHYRVCEFGGDDCIKSPSVVDRSAHRFKTKLVEKVRFRLEQLKDTCDLEKFQKEFENEKA